MKLLQGYVKNKTLEVVLTALFAALFVISRQFRIPIAPGVVIRLSTVFAYLPAMFVSWSFTLVMPVVAAATGSSPLRNLVTGTTGIQMFYFLSRILLRRWRFLAFVPSTYVANLVGAYMRYLLLGLPLVVGVPACMVKATVGATCVVLIPPILKTLEIMGVVDFDRDN